MGRTMELFSRELHGRTKITMVWSILLYEAK